MRRGRQLLLMSMAWFLTTPWIGAEEPAVAGMVIEIVETGGARSAIVTHGTFEQTIALQTDAPSQAVIVPAMLADLPMEFTVEWADQRTVSLPALWLGLPSGEKLRIRLYRHNFEPSDQQEAEDLCYHSEIDNPLMAYRALFGCQEWTLLMEREDPRWTESHLRGLNGWFRGAYYLFAKHKVSDGIGVGHWGMQPELIKRLEDVIQSIRSGKRQSDSFKPLRIADVENAIVEARQWELKLNRRIPRLLRAGNLLEARRVGDRVLQSYDNFVQSLAPAERSEDMIVDGLRRSDLVKQLADIDARLGAAGMAP